MSKVLYSTTNCHDRVLKDLLNIMLDMTYVCVCVAASINRRVLPHFCTIIIFYSHPFLHSLIPRTTCAPITQVMSPDSRAVSQIPSFCNCNCILKDSHDFRDFHLLISTINILIQRKVTLLQFQNILSLLP